MFNFTSSILLYYHPPVCIVLLFQWLVLLLNFNYVSSLWLCLLQHFQVLDYFTSRFPCVVSLFCEGVGRFVY